MERNLIQAEAGRRGITPAVTAFTVLDEKALQAWRRRGMMETRLIFLLTVAIFISGLAVIGLLYSKTAPSPAPRLPNDGSSVQQESVVQESEAEISWLSSQLRLTETQTGKIRPIVADEERRIDLAVQDASLSSEARIAKINRIHLGTLAMVAPLLNSSQDARLQALRQQEETQLRAVRDHPPAGAPQGGDE